MKIGMVGLGKMGGNMTTRLLKGGHEVVVFDRNADKRERAAAEGAITATDLGSVVSQLDPPRLIWIMIQAGAPTEAVIEALVQYLQAGDTIIDGGNSN